MPIYEYICTQCGREFEKIVFGKQKVTCPHCQARKVTRKLSVFGIGGTPPAGSGCAGCHSKKCGSCK